MELLRALVGSQIRIEVVVGRDLPPVRGEAGQFRRVLMNLAVNARDAPRGQTDTVLDLRQGSLSTESNRGAIDRLQPVLHFLTFLAGTRKRRLIVYAVCAAASLLAGWLVRERAHELTRGNALSVLNAVAETSASYVNSMFKEWTRDAETAVAENHGRDAALAAIRKPNPEAWRRFDSYASRALEGGEFSGYELTDPQVVIIRGRNHDYEGMQPTEAGAALVSEIDSTKRPVVRILGVHRMIRSIVGDGSLVPSLLIMTPVLDEKGGMAGIYMEAKPLASLAEMLRHTRMIATAETYLFTSEGQMITPSRFLDDMRRWGLVYEPKISIAAPFVMLRDPGRALRESHGLRPGEDPSTWPNTEVYRIASAAAADPAKPRAGLIAEPYRDYRGEKVVGAWRWLSDYNLGLVTEVDEAEINGVPALVDRFMLALLLITGLAGTWTLISSGWLLRLGAEVSRRNESMGQYTLLEKIGEGGMGEVYLARHPLLKRMSTLKVLRRDQTGSVPEALFENEVQIASRLVFRTPLKYTITVARGMNVLLRDAVSARQGSGRVGCGPRRHARGAGDSYRTADLRGSCRSPRAGPVAQRRQAQQCDGLRAGRRV